MLRHEIRVKSNFPIVEEESPAFKLFFKSLNLQITNMFASDVEKSTSLEEFIQKFSSAMPFFSYNFVEKPPYIISIRTICHSQYTIGVGRFVTDTCSRWLLPGKQLPVVYINALAFHFDSELSPGYFFHEMLIEAGNLENLSRIKTNLDPLIKELKLNIMAVEHTRTIVSLKPLTIDQKKMVIKENLASLLDRPSKEFDLESFDQMHHAILKILGEEKVKHVREHVASLYETRPQVFERDIFNELQHFIQQFKDTFMAIRDVKFITRVAAYMYLFRKNLNNSIIFEPYKRHLSLKILKTHLHDTDNGHQVLGIIIGINLLRENEIFQQKHILEAIRSCLPHAKLHQEYSIVDRRGNDKIRILYLEIAKKDYQLFDVKEIKSLRKKLPFELKSSIESMINPVFMPRNEEEVMRNILTLSQQLKFVQDIPQVIISFQKQTDNTVSFTVVLLRLLKPGAIPLKTLLAASQNSLVHFDNLDTKVVGQLRKRYSKEANVFEVHMKKNEFLRKDYSLDLYEARKKVYFILTQTIGEVRDYNGGMISKQTEVFKQLSQIVKKENIHNEFLLKNFFYSINPIYMQSLLPPMILAKLFFLLNEALYHHDYNVKTYFLKHTTEGSYFILLLGAINLTFKEFITKKIEDSPFADHLVSSFITTYDISCAGYLLKYETDQEYIDFLQGIHGRIREWESHMKRSQHSEPFPLKMETSPTLNGKV